MRLVGLLSFAVLACGDNVVIPPDPGSLIAVRANSKVGVLLDEFPVAMRDRVADELLVAPDELWIQRAKLQLRLTSLRLVYREVFYDEDSGKRALPLPPESQWEIELLGLERETIDGHDLVTMNYTMRGTLLSTLDAPGESDPQLASFNTSINEPFVLPVDPTLLLQRTGFACMDEDQFPPDSVDAENAYQFYDDTCEVEDPLTVSCHLTTLPNESCVEAVARVIGGVEVDINFRRLEWNDALAATVRTEVTTPDAPDLKVLTTEYHQSLSNNRVVYKYFEPDSCALLEEPGCVGGPGWRRLLEFDSIDHNVGGKPLHIGPVDYLNEGLGGELIDKNVYTLSLCHGHFHFLYYGNFGFGTGASEKVQKNGFCLESTGRLSNHELSPLVTTYTCENQGVDVGWVDLYAAGLTCNWVDVTDVITSPVPVTAPLFFQSNPDGFMCEGELVVDAAGAQVFEPTTFVSPAGDPVERPACDEAEGTEANDRGEVMVNLKEQGGMMTTPCRPEDQAFGPTRNCGFTQQATLRACAAGAPRAISCTGGSAAQPMIVRICETSRVFQHGVDCSFQDALANIIVDAGATATTFTCPAGRDAVEIGGQFAVYTAPLFDPDGERTITCN